MKRSLIVTGLAAVLVGCSHNFLEIESDTTWTAEWEIGHSAEGTGDYVIEAVLGCADVKKKTRDGYLRARRFVRNDLSSDQYGPWVETTKDYGQVTACIH